MQGHENLWDRSTNYLCLEKNLNLNCVFFLCKLFLHFSRNIIHSNLLNPFNFSAISWKVPLLSFWWILSQTRSLREFPNKKIPNGGTPFDENEFVMPLKLDPLTHVPSPQKRCLVSENSLAIFITNFRPLLFPPKFWTASHRVSIPILFFLPQSQQHRVPDLPMSYCCSALFIKF